MHVTCKLQSNKQIKDKITRNMSQEVTQSTSQKTETNEANTNQVATEGAQLEQNVS